MSDIIPILTIVDGQPSVSSLDVAEKFGKRHTEVLRSIQNLTADLPSDFNQRNFASVDYTDAKGEKRPAYNLTRDGFSLLAMGFTGKEALGWKVKYIQAFNAMEEELLRKSEAVKNSRQKQLVPPKDPYVAYMEHVEEARQATRKLVDNLVDEGMKLADPRKFGCRVFSSFIPLLHEWLIRVIVYPSTLKVEEGKFRDRDAIDLLLNVEKLLSHK